MQRLPRSGELRISTEFPCQSVSQIQCNFLARGFGRYGCPILEYPGDVLGRKMCFCNATVLVPHPLDFLLQSLESFFHLEDHWIWTHNPSFANETLLPFLEEDPKKLKHVIIFDDFIAAPLPRTVRTRAASWQRAEKRAIPLSNTRLYVAKERRRHLLRSDQYNCIQGRQRARGQLTSSLYSVFKTLTQTSGLVSLVPILYCRSSRQRGCVVSSKKERILSCCGCRG